MKVLLDMNIPLKYTGLLAAKGIESLRWSDVGAPNASDATIMAYAFEKNYTILTFDLDFSALLSNTHDLKPSVVQIRASIHHAEKAVDLITAVLFRCEDELEKGAIITIDLNKTRIRLLPL